MIHRFALATLAIVLLSGAGAGSGDKRKSTGDPSLDLAINQALDKGTAYLIRNLPKRVGGQHALALYAALEGGASITKPEVRTALEKSLVHRTRETYTAGVQLMLFQKYGGARAMPAIKATARRLLAWQNKDGGWGYGSPKTRSDNSCTQYALLGLRAALVAGVTIPREKVIRTIRYILSTAGKEGGFSYLAGGRRRQLTLTMTAGGIGSLEVCKEMLGSHQLVSTLGKRLESTSRMSVNWLAKRTSRHLGEQGRMSMGMGYFLYALERAMVLKEMDLLGDLPWYPEGAMYLVKRQLHDGAWHGDLTGSSFAVLFLSRAFQTLKAITRLSPEALLLRLKGDATRQEVEKLAARIAGQGVAAAPACLKVLRGPIRIQRRAAAIALERITGLKSGFDPRGEPESPANQDAARKWERWWMANRRKAKSRQAKAR